MQSIKFNEGYKEYAINGDESRIIRINPSDFGIIKRMQDALKALEAINADNSPDGMAEADRIAREQIDNVFGDGTSEVVFGRTNCMSFAGGQPICANFIEAISPIIEADIKAEAAKSEERIAKYKASMNR